jgi:hypothetical protein
VISLESGAASAPSQARDYVPLSVSTTASKHVEDAGDADGDRALEQHANKP